MREQKRTRQHMCESVARMEMSRGSGYLSAKIMKGTVIWSQKTKTNKKQHLAGVN